MTSGRGAPGRLGAYFNRLSPHQVGIGSYEAVSGTPAAPGAAEQTLIGVVQVQAPAGPYTVWAERSGTGSFAEQPAADRLLYVLNDQQIAASERMIGEPPAYLAVLTDLPGDSGGVSAAFGDTRYVWVKTEAVYSQADQNRIPKMLFLHWAELRPVDQWKGRSETEQRAASRIGGTLVFPVVVPVSPSDRERPQGTFTDAFGAQFPNGGKFLPRVVSSPEQTGDDVRAIAQREAAKSALTVLAILGCLALAGVAGYRATQSMRGQLA